MKSHQEEIEQDKKKQQGPVSTIYLHHPYQLWESVYQLNHEMSIPKVFFKPGQDAAIFIFPDFIQGMIALRVDHQIMDFV